jgi:hypothetical protein
MMTITVADPDRGIDIADAVDEFRSFGAALDLPPGTVDVQLTAPGGLGGTFVGAGGRIGPVLVKDSLTRTRLRVVHPEHGAVAELGLTTSSVTRGELGGLEIAAADNENILQVRIRLKPFATSDSGTLTFRWALNSIHGHPVQQILPAVRLLAGFVAPYELHWLEEYGSTVLISHAFGDAPAAPSLTEGLLRF